MLAQINVETTNVESTNIEPKNNFFQEMSKNQVPIVEPTATSEENDKKVQSKYKNITNGTNYYSNSSAESETNYNTIEQILESEKQHNKTEMWNKLDKTVKIQKLHNFAEKYGKDHTLPVKDVKTLKTFFIACLEKNKLQKTKDVTYDKDSGNITSIPSLHFNVTNHNFTLKIVDAKRVSTLKSLTPKRVTLTESIEANV